MMTASSRVLLTILLSAALAACVTATRQEATEPEGSGEPEADAAEPEGDGSSSEPEGDGSSSEPEGDPDSEEPEEDAEREDGEGPEGDSAEPDGDAAEPEGDSVEPKGDTDAEEPDVVEPTPAPETHKLWCEDWCTDVADQPECGIFELLEMDGEIGCYNDCLDWMAEDTAYAVAEMSCWKESCGPGGCEDIELSAFCNIACDKLEDCDAWDLIEMEAGDVAICQGECSTGMALDDGSFAGQLTCAFEELTKDCEADVDTLCFVEPEEAWCETWCQASETSDQCDIYAWLEVEDVESCASACEETIEEMGKAGGTAYLACMAQSCSPEYCEGVKLLEGCESACELVSGCGFEESLDLPADAELCIGDCSGDNAGNPFGVELLECVQATLSVSCEPDFLGLCYEQAFDCESACLWVYNQSGESKCAEDSALVQAIPDYESCVDLCGQQPEDTEIMFFSCLSVAGCNDPGPCKDIPEEESGHCEDACAGLEALCETDNPVPELPDGSWCDDFCTGAATYFGLPTSEDTYDCIVGAPQCPMEIEPTGEDDNPTFGLMFQCLLEPSEECQALCGPVQECMPAGEQDGCAIGCGQLQVSDPELFAWVETCVLDVAEDCDAVLQCIGEASGGGGDLVDPHALCEAACKGGADCPGPPDGSCVEECKWAVENVAADSYDLAALMCYAVIPCEEGDEVCESTEVSEKIAQQCKGSCGDYEGDEHACIQAFGGAGCVDACIGTMLGYGMKNTSMVGCVVDALGGAGCDPGEAYKCKGNPTGGED